MRITKKALQQIIKEELSHIVEAREDGSWEDIYYAEIPVDPYEHQGVMDSEYDYYRESTLDEVLGLQSYDIVDDNLIGVTGTRDALIETMERFYPEGEGCDDEWDSFNRSMKHLGDPENMPIGSH